MDNQLKKWIKGVEATKRAIKRLKTEDRLQTCSGLLKIHTSIAASLHGWGAWLKNPAVLDQLSEEELKESFDVFKKLAVEFLDLDLKMSKSVAAGEPGKAKEKRSYVS